MTSPTATTRMQRPTFWQYAWPTVGFGVLYVAVAYCAAFIGFNSFSWRFVVAIVTAAIVLLGLVVGYAIAIRLARARLARIADAAPGALVFGFTSAVGFGNLFPDPQTHKPLQATLSQGFGASADATGITVWYGNTPLTVASLGWKSVTSVTTDRIASGGLKYPAVVVSYLADDGSTKTLTLVKANAEALPVRSAVEVAWIAGELNALRTHG